MIRDLLTPYDFQQRIINKISPYDYYALFLDMGTGKSLITINVLRNKFRKHGVFKVLVLCPIIVIRNWRNEFLMSMQLPEKHVAVIDGSTKKKRLKQLANKDNIVTILNYDALLTTDIEEFLTEWAPTAVICDESHKIKTRTSARFKAVRRISKHSSFRYILTGTPITNNLMDLFAQYLFLDKGRAFGDSFTAFRNRYFIDMNAGWKASGKTGYFPDFQVIDSLLPEVTRKLEATSVRLKKEDCLDLPEYTMQIVDFDLSSEQQKHYNEVRDELITWLEKQEDNPLVAKNALTKILRLNEISSGYMKLEDGSVHKFKMNPRFSACMELVECLAPYKTIIFAVYRQSYADLIAGLDKRGIKYVELHGGISSKQKLENVDLFNDLSLDYQVCLANPKSAGLGVNLKPARYKIYYNRTYSLDDYLQSRDRNNRAGSLEFHDKITDYNLIAGKTIDAVIFDKVLHKKKFSEKILDIKRMLI